MIPAPTIRTSASWCCSRRSEAAAEAEEEFATWPFGRAIFEERNDGQLDRQDSGNSESIFDWVRGGIGVELRAGEKKKRKEKENE